MLTPLACCTQMTTTKFKSLPLKPTDGKPLQVPFDFFPEFKPQQLGVEFRMTVNDAVSGNVDRSFKALQLAPDSLSPLSKRERSTTSMLTRAQSPLSSPRRAGLILSCSPSMPFLLALWEQPSTGLRRTSPDPRRFRSERSVRRVSSRPQRQRRRAQRDRRFPRPLPRPLRTTKAGSRSTTSSAREQAARAQEPAAQPRPESKQAGEGRETWQCMSGTDGTKEAP